MHVGSLFAPILAPVAVYAVNRNRSQFVASHAMKAIKEWLVLKVALLAAAIVSLTYTIVRLINLYKNDWQGFSIWEFLIRFAIGYLVLTILGAITALITCVQAVQAWRGMWPRGARVSSVSR